MFVNADFSRIACVSSADYHWVASPHEGIDRVILDRIGDEKARATTIVRYAPGASFPAHEHPGGEEIFVLSGTFSEAGKDYPAGLYIRNPPGSVHQPYSHEGATIFVKLWQMQTSERQRLCIDTRDKTLWQYHDERAVCPLFFNANEKVFLQHIPAGEGLFPGTLLDTEILVLAGAILMNGQRYSHGSWIRLPAGSSAKVSVADKGATLYTKYSNLAETSWVEPGK